MTSNVVEKNPSFFEDGELSSVSTEGVPFGNIPNAFSELSQSNNLSVVFRIPKENFPSEFNSCSRKRTEQGLFQVVSFEIQEEGVKNDNELLVIVIRWKQFEDIICTMFDLFFNYCWAMEMCHIQQALECFTRLASASKETLLNHKSDILCLDDLLFFYCVYFQEEDGKRYDTLVKFTNTL